MEDKIHSKGQSCVYVCVHSKRLHTCIFIRGGKNAERYSGLTKFIPLHWILFRSCWKIKNFKFLAICSHAIHAISSILFVFLAWAASVLPLSYDKWTTISLHNVLHRWYWMLQLHSSQEENRIFNFISRLDWPGNEAKGIMYLIPM